MNDDVRTLAWLNLAADLFAQRFGALIGAVRPDVGTAEPSRRTQGWRASVSPTQNNDVRLFDVELVGPSVVSVQWAQRPGATQQTIEVVSSIDGGTRTRELVLLGQGIAFSVPAGRCVARVRSGVAGATGDVVATIGPGVATTEHYAERYPLSVTSVVNVTPPAFARTVTFVAAGDAASQITIGLAITDQVLDAGESITLAADNYQVTGTGTVDGEFHAIWEVTA